MPEATNSENVLFGTDRMLAALNQKPDAGCREVLQDVHRAIDVFMDGAPQFDDITMLALTVNSKGDVHAASTENELP